MQLTVWIARVAEGRWTSIADVKSSCRCSDGKTQGHGPQWHIRNSLRARPASATPADAEIIGMKTKGPSATASVPAIGAKAMMLGSDGAPNAFRARRTDVPIG